jgi:hypothetical protein
MVEYGRPPAWTGLANASLDLTYNTTTEGEPQPVFVVGSHAFAVTFTQQQNLIDFPFDKQAATFSFINAGSAAQNLFFVPAPAMTASGNASSLYIQNIDGFVVESTGAVIDTRGQNSRVTITYYLARSFNAHHAAPARCARNCDPKNPQTQTRPRAPRPQTNR